jgi:hypothetical protein
MPYQNRSQLAVRAAKFGPEADFLLRIPWHASSFFSQGQWVKIPLLWNLYVSENNEGF